MIIIGFKYFIECYYGKPPQSTFRTIGIRKENK